MSNRSSEEFHDQIITANETEGLPERFFDRFVFNLHPVDGSRPSIIMGLGLHPQRNIMDGFTQLSTESEQRNVRYSTELSATSWDTCGPFSYEVVDPNKTWRLKLADNPSGMTFDLTWQARTPAWWGDIDVTNSSGEGTSFAHLFQSGYVDGTITIDGSEQRVQRWYSQRDRSRGVRTMQGGQGLHIWYQAQFADCSVGFLLVEGRDGSKLLLEGAVMHADGRLDEIIDVKHDLDFDDQLDLKSGLIQVSTASGAVLPIETDARGGGGLMAGAGYGGHHGESLGVDHVEGETWPLDGSITQRTVDSSLTDRLARFSWDGKEGSGIFEFALTRSSSYSYNPTLD